MESVQATLDLQRDRVLLNNLTLTAGGSGIQKEVLLVTGNLEDFTHPRWQAKVAGNLDMRLLDPITGYPDAPIGIAQVDLTAEGLKEPSTSMAVFM